MIKLLNEACKKDPAFCPNSCGRSYKGVQRKGNLKHHMIYACENNIIKLLNEASKDDPAFCPNGCGRSYKGIKRKGNLHQHMIYTCGVNPQFQCAICQKQLRYYNSLKYHMATVHNQFSTRQNYM
ncbi:Zinc finger C2H2-type [Cinara cedri]|uniref:Zinc finger C2H2-type n=1 Tax=Cinara cedri TaxID=506608 RepID=A0A5E4M938_9HEMI|nr:Zinc finger C2H2-type [Cinara cedri]